jgi:molybdopterin-binding protein
MIRKLGHVAMPVNDSQRPLVHLKLKKGQPACAVIKASSVMIGSE